MTLTIDADVVVERRSGTTIVVAGRGVLDRQGTTAEAAAFTCWKDDAYGGDTNDDLARSLLATDNCASLGVQVGGRPSHAHPLVLYVGASDHSSIFAHGGTVAVADSTLERKGRNGVPLLFGGAPAQVTLIGGVVQ